MPNVQEEYQLPPLKTLDRYAITTTKSVELDQQQIERCIMAAYNLPAGTEFIWDISSQGLLRSVEVRHTQVSESPKP